MPVTNIADVTNEIIKKIKKGLSDFGMPENVFADSFMREQKQGVSFYLYHLRENAAFKNTPPPGRDIPSTKITPMGLVLYYQLTAFSESTGGGDAAFEEQQMMTAALKALHEAPLIFLDNDRFSINMQPLPATDAVHNWTAGSSPVSLSAYYEVSPVFIEPEKPTLYPGRVLQYGNYIFTAGLPRITASRSTIEFTLPGEATRQITAQPAQAPPGGSIIFEGTGFQNGTSPQLRLFNFRYKENVAASGWNIVVAPNQLTVTINETANLERNGDLVAVLPGIYSAQIVVTRTMPLPGGESKEFKQYSNQFPFSILPLAVAGTFSDTTLNVTGYGFQTRGELEEDNGPKMELMDVYIGEYNLLRSAGEDAPGPGKFHVSSGTQLELNLPEDMVTGRVPLRIVVAGAESSPAWVDLL